MRTRILTAICLCLLLAGRASAQWAVIDPSNIAQSIINNGKNMVHTSSTATNMVNNFKETVKIYEQGKKYYDALKSVNNLVKDARKVQQTILMVGDITDIYVNNFQKMMRDENFTVEELGAIAFGYTKLLEESNDVLTELKNVVNITTLSMTDKERMDVVERCYIQVYIWLPVSDMFSTVLAKIQVLMLQSDIERMQADPNFSLDSSDGVYIVFMAIGIIGYFTIPTVAGWIIQAGGMGGYNRNMNQMAGRAGGFAGSVAGATAGNAAGRVGKLLK